MKRIALTMISHDLVRDKETLTGLSAVLRWFPPPQAARIVLEIARSAVLKDRLNLAAVAAARVLASPDSDDRMKLRARLYQGAARTMMDAYDKGVSELSEVDPVELGAADRSLLGAALETARRVHRYSEIRTVDVASVGGSSPTIDAASEALAEARSVEAEN
jgi:chemotaxis protein MotC